MGALAVEGDRTNELRPGTARSDGTIGPDQLDGEAFSALVRAYHPSLVRVALTFVRNPVVAEDVAQETWIGVLRGYDRFAGRCSLRTWIFRILTNIAKTRAEREARSIPFSSFEEEGGEAVEAEHFTRTGDGTGSGWSSASFGWREPDELLLAKEARCDIAAAIATLPAMQRRVITLRGLEGRSAQEVCELLGLSEVNQRVLLHRARARVRAAIGAEATGA